jgi:hypothetical protein
VASARAGGTGVLFCLLWLLTSDFRLLAFFSARPDQLIRNAIQIKAKANRQGAKNAKVLTTDKHKRMRIFNRERRQTG